MYVVCILHFIEPCIYFKMNKGKIIPTYICLLNIITNLFHFTIPLLYLDVYHNGQIVETHFDADLNARNTAQQWEVTDTKVKSRIQINWISMYYVSPAVKKKF